MKLDNVPSLRVEDFDSEKTWIGKLFFQLNPFFASLSALLTQNVDFSSNIQSVSKAFTDITSFQEFSLSWPSALTPPSDVRVIKATKGTDSTPVILLIAWSYDPGQKLITISRLTEVLSTSVADLSGTYAFTVRATV